MELRDLIFSKEEIATFVKRLWKSRNNAVVLLFPYGAWISIGVIICVLLNFIFKYLGVTNNFSDTVYRIIGSFLMLLPTVTLWKHKEEFGGEDGTTEGIIDMSIGVWIASLFAIWI